MQTIYDLMANLGGWNWIIFALLLLSLEVVLPGVHFLWFGLAAFLVGILAISLDAAGPGYAAAFPWQFELITFALVSMATVFFIRRYASDSGGGPTDAPSLNVRANQYVGRTTVVAVPIVGGRGKVKIGDSLWQAEGPDLAEGAKVRITGVNGALLVVEPL